MSLWGFGDLDGADTGPRTTRGTAGTSLAVVRPLVVFDIDGVLADVRHRVHFLAAPGPDWNAFFVAAVNDPPLTDGLALVQEAAREAEVAYLTGRPERCRADTLGWLRLHQLPQGRLVMRRDDDRRPARLVKPPTLRELARGRTVALVVDDDLLVCDAYEAAGWTVLRATWADQLPALTQAQETDGRT